MTDVPRAPLLTRRRLLLTLGAAGASAAAGSLVWRFGQHAPPPRDRLKAARRTGFALGTGMSIVALHEDHATAESGIDAAFAELETVESVLSLYRPQSQLCILNRHGVLAGPHPYLVQVLERARDMSVASGGDFDATVQPLWNVYADAKKNGRLPSADQIERARRLVDWRRVRVGEDRICLEGSGTAVTLNGIAQGFAADRALEALAAKDVRHALVDTGEIAVRGRRRDGNLWTVGIQHPRQKDAFISRACLDGRCVATSGDYATTFTPDCVHHHIFDPRTGRSPNVFQSVTVLAKTGLEADALSTTVFVAGLERGIKLIESSRGADTLFVLKNGKTLATSGFPGRA
jgi:thiamine biosynthesis lipoprotein